MSEIKKNLRLEDERRLKGRSHTKRSFVQINIWALLYVYKLW